jgi:hypothetical protein
MNLQEVADGIAARFASISATVSGTTETLSATASLPNQIAKGPVLLVYPPSGSLEVGVSKLRQDILEFPVRLLRDPINVPSRTAWLYAWATAMRDQVEKNMDLDLAYVAWAQSTALRIELDGEEYASVSGTRATFDVVEITVTVRFNEVVTTVSV